MPELQTDARQEKPLNPLQVLVNAIVDAREKALRSKISKPSKREVLWFSDVHPCARRNYYAMAHGDERSTWDSTVQAKMDAGTEWEHINKRELSKLGFEPLLAQEVVEVKRNGRVIARGKTDFSIAAIDNHRMTFPFEHKCVQKQVFDAVREWRDLLRNQWTAKYVRQLMLYMYGLGKDLGAFMLCDFQGHWKFLVVELDYDIVEETLRLMETAIDAFHAGQPPDRIVYDTQICGKCDFCCLCVPDIKGDPRLRVVDNPTLAAALEVRDANVDAHKKYEAADKIVKSHFEDVKDGQFTVGNFIIIRTNVPRMTYAYPDEVKAKYGSKKDSFRNKIERFQKPDPDTIYVEPTRIIEIMED